jgi:hypothetical protein
MTVPGVNVIVAVTFAPRSATSLSLPTAASDGCRSESSLARKIYRRAGYPQGAKK